MFIDAYINNYMNLFDDILYILTQILKFTFYILSFLIAIIAIEAEVSSIFNFDKQFNYNLSSIFASIYKTFSFVTT